jgi:hypothetical protein
VVERAGVPLPGGLRFVLMWTAVFALIPWVMSLRGQQAFNGALNLPPRILPLVLTPLFFFGCYFCAVQLALEAFRTEKAFGLDVKATGRTADDVAFFQHHLENVVFYLDMTPPNHAVLEDSAAAYEFLQANSNAVVILRRRSLDDMLAAFPSDNQGGAAVEETFFSWEKEKKKPKKIVAWSLQDVNATE